MMTEETKTKLEAFYNRRPDWLSGCISGEDATLFADFIDEGVKGPMIEIGVASGWSSAVLLHLFNNNPPCDGTWLYSYDVIDYCYFDKNRPMGSAVDEMAPELKEHWDLRIGNALKACQDHAGNPVSFAFIDADHRHPYATVDLLALLPVLKPDAWVVLHDVNLPNITTVKEWQVYGPKYLYDAWPWQKRLVRGAQNNIGAVQVPGDHQAVRDFCITLLGKEWEAVVPDSLIEQLGLLAHKPENL